ncbi:hypothetical protein [Sphingobium sp.]
MPLLRSVERILSRLRTAARREFLRDPDVILFERRAEPVRDGRHGR